MRSPRALLLLAIALPLRGQYAGAEACARCHAGIASRHGNILQRASKQSIEGDFARTATVPLRAGNGAWFIADHRVDYTLGGRRIQQYLTTMPDGRIVILPVAWDNVGKKWIADAEVDNPEESGQVWNKDCYSCHVSGAQKNFDPEHDRYHTTWKGTGADCERCHGPGSSHAAKPTRANIVNPARLEPALSTMVCAQCHSFRDVYSDGFPAGGNYYDSFSPVMEYRLPASEDPAYWADGRPRWLSNEAGALWRSQCFLKGGATCVTCHTGSHKPEARVAPDVCAGCHKAIASAASAHTHHAPSSAGSSCVECHMPAIVVGLRTRWRDHSLSIPVPENTLGSGIPNACNLCHKDKDAAWASRQMTAWYGVRSRQKPIGRATAFTQAKKGNPAAVPALLEILSDVSGGPWLRANAAGYLGSFPDDPAAYAALLHAFSDAEPLVRATAASAIRPRGAQREALAPQLVALLQDPVRTVRMNAGIAMVAMGVRPFPGEEGARFEQAKELYRARAEINNDDAQQQLAAGRFSSLSGDAPGAVTALRAALKLDPSLPAQYLLARSLADAGDLPAARRTLQAIPRDNSQYAGAQRLLAELDANDSGRAGGADGQALFLQGQVQYQTEYYGAALKDLEEALRLGPQAEWAEKARIYRAICLEKLSRTAEAETAMQALSDNPDVDLQLAYVELLSDTGRAEAALARVDRLIAADPKAPLANFWRAKVLLQLRRTGDAAAAAEESIRLQPQLPAAHNLLIRIYQMQGRTKEAEQQAEWLRDYQRRSH